MKRRGCLFTNTMLAANAWRNAETRRGKTLCPCVATTAQCQCEGELGYVVNGLKFTNRDNQMGRNNFPDTFPTIYSGLSVIILFNT